MKETNKVFCILAYLIFFIPLLVDSENEAYRFHANQGLVLLILSFIISGVGAILPVIGWFIILPLGGIFCLVLAIIGMVNASQDQMKELPLIGKIKIIK